jgi:hypothetical protein
MGVSNFCQMATVIRRTIRERHETIAVMPSALHR